MAQNEARNLVRAVEHRDIENLTRILESSPKAYKTAVFKETDVLQIACGLGHTECAQLLIAHGAIIDRHTSSEWAPLHSACYRGHVACAQLLIDHGAKVDELTHDFDGCDGEGRTPLHLACEGQSQSVFNIEECLRLLVKHGANVNAEDRSGRTPLHKACDSPRLVMALLELGADVSLRDGEGRSALEVTRNEYCAKLLRAT
jgi:ankyrin repeat protein